MQLEARSRAHTYEKPKNYQQFAVIYFQRLSLGGASVLHVVHICNT